MAGRRELGEVLLERWVPPIDDSNAFFWHSGADGKLRLLRCGACGYITHPAGPRCVNCLSVDLAPDEMCGTGKVATFTVNHHQWVKGQPPYIIAMVELDDQVGLRLQTNLVRVDDEEIELDMPVRVLFEEGPDNVWFPVFAPVDR